MRARTLGALVATAAVLLVGCQPSDGGGGGQKPPGYDKLDQPPVNRLGTPDPPLEGGRVGRGAEGPNRGAAGNPPPEGYRGSGSAYNPPPAPIMKKQKVGASPAPKTPPPSR